MCLYWGTAGVLTQFCNSQGDEKWQLTLPEPGNAIASTDENNLTALESLDCESAVLTCGMAIAVPLLEASAGALTNLRRLSQHA
jgi:hypothetical protein